MKAIYKSHTRFGEYKVTERTEALQELLKTQKRMDRVRKRRIKEGFEPRTNVLFR